MKRKCWCGSQLDYHDCHEAFDKKLKQYKKHGYLIPNHKMIKNEKQIEAIKRAAVVNNGLLDYIEEHIQIGMTTQDIDDMAVAYTSSHGGYSADLNYEGYPKSICTSVNDEVCHGIPGDYVLQDGDIINVDATTGVNGYYADASRMFMLGHVSEEAQRLVKVTKECLEEGMKAVKLGKVLLLISVQQLKSMPMLMDIVLSKNSVVMVLEKPCMRILMYIIIHQKKRLY